MPEDLPSNLPSHASEAPAVLVWLPGMAHNQAPVQAQQGWRQGLERLRRMVGDLLPTRALPGASEGLQAGNLGALIDACRRFQQGSPAGREPSFAAHLGVAMVHSQDVVKPEEIQRAQCIARFSPIGTIGLQAEAVDAFARSWELPLVDLGEVQCTECGDLKPATKVLALTADQGTKLPDPLALRDVLVVLNPILEGYNPAQLKAAADLLADTMRTSLTRSALVRVVAAESTRRLIQPEKAVEDAFQLLRATHVLVSRGRLAVGGQLQLDLELLGRGRANAIWRDSVSLDIGALLAGKAEKLMDALASVHSAMLSESLDLAQLPSWETLEDHQLLISASQYMHRLSPASFEHSRLLLESLRQRAPQQAMVHAWLAKWHVMAAVQGLEPVQAAALNATQSVDEAVKLNPYCALALALGGMARLMQREPLASTGAWFERAVDANPNEALAWMYRSTQAVYEGRQSDGLHAIRIALALSPLDPWRYMFDMAAAHALLATGDWAGAYVYLQSAARARARHAPTLAFLVIAQARLGRLDLAHEHLKQLLELWPQYSLTRFWESYPGRDAPHAKEFAWAFTSAGLASD